MNSLLGILAGTGTGVFITLLPGMLNMQVVSTSLQAGRRAAYIFSAGLVFVIAGQAALAVLFADYLVQSNIIATIKLWAIPLLLVLAAIFTVKGYLARKARRENKKKHYSGGPLWRGIVISAVNVLNIPFIFALASFQLAHGWLANDYFSRLLFIPGVVLGASVVFFTYARTADWMSRHVAYFTRNIYFFVGGLLAVLALVQVFRVS